MDAVVEPWQSGRPPNREIVEVEWEGKIIRVQAIWGQDGVLPHWEAEDRSCLWEPAAFKNWRRPSADTSSR
jgi:hypothetical protein